MRVVVPRLDAAVDLFQGFGGMLNPIWLACLPNVACTLLK